MPSQDTPLTITLPDHLQARLDGITAGARARFGHGQYVMVEGGGDSGSGDGGDGGDGGPEGGDGADGSSDDGNGSDADTSDWAKGWDGKVESLPPRVQKLLKDARGEAAEHRTKATSAEKKQAETLDAIAKALGLKGEEKTDPAKLQQQLDQTQQQARAAAVELAVYKAASKHQGDPDALLDSRAFQAKVAELDPADAKFADKVTDAIKDAVASNPKLKATQAAGSSSADHGAGGSGEGTKRTPKSLTDAVGSHYGA